MEFVLKNNYKYNLPKGKRLLLFGANRTGKTIISKEVNEYYDNKDGYYSLLFNRDIMANNFISTSNRNEFTVTPFANERRKLEELVNDYQKEFNLDELLKKVFNEKTSSAYSYFNRIKEMFENKNIVDVIGFEKTFTLKNLFYTEKFNFNNYFELEFIQKCIKKKTGLLRFLDLIKKMDEEKVFEKISKLEDFLDGFLPEEYLIKERIVKGNLKNCPICYSQISIESKNKIIEDLNRIIISEEIKNSFLYYVNLDEKFKDIFISFIDNYKENYVSFVEKIENSIMYYLVLNINVDNMKKLNNIINQYKEINIKSKKFYLSQEDKNSTIYKNIEKEFDRFNNYTNSKFTFEIKSGKLIVSSMHKQIDSLSLSEQKLLQFIYFRILFLQHIEEKNDKMVIIIDDPFDSYDDVYVYNMINIIFELIKLYDSNIDRFIVLSHNLISLQLLNDEFTKKGFVFTFYWLDIIQNTNEISNIKDNFKIMQKIDQNISSFGLPLKLIERMMDQYSLIVFSSIVRENSQFNWYISEDKSPNSVLKKTLAIHKKYYDIVSERINHNRKNMSIESLYRINKKLYGYPSYISKYKSVRATFNNIPSKYDDLELIQSKNGKIFKTNDLINLFVWKYLCVLKIRRLLERKLYIQLGKPDYTKIGDLICLVDKTKQNCLYDFYCKHNNLFNAFNHSSSEIIPPILIYHASYIYDALKEIEKLS